ncbi:hypothetical protein ADK67_25830 [Saccharothrix sp. NRRL B-16348]|uniref:hypothetical protein n=1 Tax=Saccharothrix sp. NRRL B-16348 TaxID=1415542 RepID=UPI0006AF85F6|nr:hypothetical protein [Saccharothrix sp. NRRL B-16348]KOX21767.1 hypothetical protein ADK67_25830 [Saccharothrix sp. NRRL B-16348]
MSEHSALTRDDHPVNLHVGGRAGAAIKEFAGRLWVGRIRREVRKPGSTIWPKGGPRPGRQRGVTSP